MLNNADIDGVGPEGPLNVGETSEDFWRQTLDVHLMGTFACTKAALKPMQEQGSGCTSNVSSEAAKPAQIGTLQVASIAFHPSLGAVNE